MNSRTIGQSHLSRKAIVYIRYKPELTKQCQVRMNRQYAMATLTEKLGWTREKIVIFDADLGKSDATITQKTDFQRLVKEIVEGKVGAILVSEITCLTRSASHWYELVGLCIAKNTLIIDCEKIYNFNFDNQGF
jgi:DNA invertase Pin-like site-specific DNA recombinase